MAELPPPPDAAPDVAVVTMVHKVKSKLGYTEINAPVSIENDKVNIFIVYFLSWAMLVNVLS